MIFADRTLFFRCRAVVLLCAIGVVAGAAARRPAQIPSRLHLGMTIAAAQAASPTKLRYKSDERGYMISDYREGGVKYEARLRFDRANRLSDLQLYTEGSRICRAIERRLSRSLGRWINHGATGDNGFELWRDVLARDYVEYREMWGGGTRCWVRKTYRLPD